MRNLILLLLISINCLGQTEEIFKLKNNLARIRDEQYKLGKEAERVEFLLRVELDKMEPSSKSTFDGKIYRIRMTQADVVYDREPGYGIIPVREYFKEGYFKEYTITKDSGRVTMILRNEDFKKDKYWISGDTITHYFHGELNLERSLITAGGMRIEMGLENRKGVGLHWRLTTRQECEEFLYSTLYGEGSQPLIRTTRPKK